MEIQEKLKIPEGTGLVRTGLSFVYPALGPASTDCLVKQARQRRMVLPTANQSLELVIFTLNNNLREFDNCIVTGLVMNTACHYFSADGVYIEDFPRLNRQGNLIRVPEKDFIRRIRKRDSKVRFIPCGYKTGDLKPEEFAENSFALGLFGGRARTEMLAQAAKDYSFDYLTLKDNNARRENQSTSDLSYISFADGYSADRIVVDTNNHTRSNGQSYAFALGEKSMKKEVKGGNS